MSQLSSGGRLYKDICNALSASSILEHVNCKCTRDTQKLIECLILVGFGFVEPLSVSKSIVVEPTTVSHDDTTVGLSRNPAVRGFLYP